MFRQAFLASLVVLPSVVTAQEATQGTGGALRVLDKVTGVATDLTLRTGAVGQVGLIAIRMNECRYPTNNPSGDAYAELTVAYRDQSLPVFSGWMIASAPALNAMDHPRYDVWVLRCTTS